MRARARRIWGKLRLRAKVARLAITQYEDTLARSRFKVSFSQSGEDLISWFLLDRLGIRTPTYVDIGAHHPEHLSNTALFHMLGGRGINIEPDPLLFAEFTSHRPRDINLNIGIADTPGSMKFYRMQDPALSTFSEAEATKLSAEYGIAVAATIEVPVDTIANVLRAHELTPDFVTVDAEGHDLRILSTYDFDRYRPAVICVETISFSLRGDGVKNQDIIDLLCSRGYRIYADTYVNTIFVDASRFGPARA